MITSLRLEQSVIILINGNRSFPNKCYNMMSYLTHWLELQITNNFDFRKMFEYTVLRFMFGALVYKIIACLEWTFGKKVIPLLNSKFNVDFKTGIDLVIWARNDEVRSKKTNLIQNQKTLKLTSMEKNTLLKKLSTCCNLA